MDQPTEDDPLHATHSAAFGETLHGTGPTLGATHAAGAATQSVGATIGGTQRTTVLPRIAQVDGAPRLVHEERPRYASLGTLGTGGMGEVTLAEDHDIGRKVALKRLHEGSDSSSLARFSDEVRIVGRLEHPNIVPIHDVGVDENGQHFFVMKYVDGETLEKIIERLVAGDPAYVSRYTHAHRVQIAIELLRALQHAHENGVIHRDLKPANIMIGRYGEVMLMDWGLAKTVRHTVTTQTARGGQGPSTLERPHATQAGAILGTPAYMSPEQAAGRHEDLDERSDLYSAAVVLFELFTLHPVRNGKTVYEIVHAVAHDPVTRGRVFNAFTAAGAPAGMAHALVVGLGHAPAERYASAAEMAARIAAVRDNVMPVQCHITFLTRVTSWMVETATRYPKAALVLLVALPLLTLFGLGKAMKLF